MKKFFLLITALFFLFFTMPLEAAGPINQDGYFRNIRLAGRVKVVDHFGDIKVQVVHSFPDIKVKVVNHFPDDIGEWQFVDYGEDFTIEYVKSFGDIKVQFVNSFPGVR